VKKLLNQVVIILFASVILCGCQFQNKIENDFSKGYTYKVENDEIKITYNNTNNTVTVGKEKKDFDFENDYKKYIRGISNVHKSFYGSRLYFQTNTWATEDAIHYVDLETLDIHYLSHGNYNGTVGQYEQSNDYSIIVSKSYYTDIGRKWSCFSYTSDGEEICELEESEELEVEINFENIMDFDIETINGVYINYDEYIGAIIPMYDGVNKDKLTSYNEDIMSEVTQKLNFAVFGLMKDTVITYREGTKDEDTILNIGTIENGIVRLKTVFNDKVSNIKVNGIVMGYKIEFNFEKNKNANEYKPIMIKMYEPKEIAMDRESKRRINIFLSNFAECFGVGFDMNNYSDKQLINFAVSHNYKNNYQLFESTNEELVLRISKNHIDRTIYKYFGIKKIKHQSVDKEITYKNDYYKMPIADGESTPFCQVTKVLACENGIYLVYANMHIDSNDLVNDPYTPRVIAKIKNTSSKKFDELNLIKYDLKNY